MSSFLLPSILRWMSAVWIQNDEEKGDSMKLKTLSKLGMALGSGFMLAHVVEATQAQVLEKQ